MVDASNKLNEAYELIEAGNMTNALTVLDEIKEEYSQNADYWWLYAHATDDEAEGQAALRRVLELDPNYPGAAGLAEQVGIEAPKPVQSIRSLKPAPPPAPPTNPNLPSTSDIEMLEDDMDFDDDFATTAPSSSNRTAIIATSLFVIILSVVAIVILLPSILGGDDETTEVANITEVDSQAVATEDPFLSTATALVLQATEGSATDIAEVTQDPEATSELDPFSITATALIRTATAGAESALAAQTEATIEEETGEATPDSTDEVTVTDDVVMTEEATELVTPNTVETDVATEGATTTDTVASSVSDFDSLVADLAEFEVPEEGISIEETSLGNTLIAQTCVPRGPRANAAINGILTALAEQSDAIGDDVEGIAVSIVDCSTNNTLNVLGITREAFDGFASGDLTISDIRRMLQLIG